MESTGFLHTDSNKSGAGAGIQGFMAESKQIDLLNKSMAFLRGQEAQLYSWVGASSYPQFMSILRQLFADAAQDAKIFNNFKKANLNSLVDKSIQNILSAERNQTITIECIAGQEIDIADLLAKGIAVHTPSVDVTVAKGQNIKMTFVFNPANIKNAINALDNRRFRANSDSMTELNKALINLIDSGRIGSIKINEKTRDIEIKEQIGSNKNNPFSYTKGSIDEALKLAKENNDTELLAKIEEARVKIYLALMELCNGGSSDLRRAFQTIWNQKVGQNIHNLSFFFKGKNISGMGGSLQEFATAMLFQYISFKTQRNINQRIAKILGDIADGGEQPKTDVEILKRIGIQVKAYNQNSLVDSHGHARMMSTNIHPSGLDAGLLGYGLNIGDAMVQCCFNTSNGYDAAYFTQIIEQYALAQTMNFTTNNLDTDTVCFYFLDAQYLVPGSVILSRLTRVEKPQVSIRQPGPIGRDETFEIKNYAAHYIDKRSGKSRAHTVERFVQYWNGDPLDASDENIDYYDALYNKRISIDVKFHYEFMYGSNFAIY